MIAGRRIELISLNSEPPFWLSNVKGPALKQYVQSKYGLRTYVCMYTCTYMYVTIIIKDREAINLRVRRNGSD